MTPFRMAQKKDTGGSLAPVRHTNVLGKDFPYSGYEVNRETMPPGREKALVDRAEMLLAECLRNRKGHPNVPPQY
jgi:hypothetical protein